MDRVMNSTRQSRNRRPTRAQAQAVAELPEIPQWDLQTTYSIARLEGDPARPSGRLLYVAGIECSYVDLLDPRHLEFSYVRRFGDLVDLRWPARAPIDVVHIGGGGVTLPRYVAATRPRSKQVVYEKDQGLIDLARRYLGLRTSPQLRVKVGDARERLAQRADASTDLVVGDAFDGVVVPAHLATAEFGAEVARVLRPDGVYALNIIDCPPLRVSRTAAATLLASWPHVVLLTSTDMLRERDAGNVVLLASAAPLPLEALAKAAGRGMLPDVLLRRPQVEEFTGGARPLTDAETDRWIAAAPPPDLPVPLPARPDPTDLPDLPDAELAEVTTLPGVSEVDGAVQS
jgi:SAM-dependent methyltransferase